MCCEFTRFVDLVRKQRAKNKNSKIGNTLGPARQQNPHSAEINTADPCHWFHICSAWSVSSPPGPGEEPPLESRTRPERSNRKRVASFHLRKLTQHILLCRIFKIKELKVDQEQNHRSSLHKRLFGSCSFVKTHPCKTDYTRLQVNILENGVNDTFLRAIENSSVRCGELRILFPFSCTSPDGGPGRCLMELIRPVSRSAQTCVRSTAANTVA